MNNYTDTFGVPDGHRYFRDADTGRWAIASGLIFARAVDLVQLLVNGGHHAEVEREEGDDE
jgi:hypothetical protein